MIRVAFRFACLFPAVIVLIELVLLLLGGKAPALLIYDFFMVLSTLIFFSFVYRGHRWAVIAVGLILVIADLADLVIVFSMLAINGTALVFAILRVAWIVFGVYLIRSRDVRAFVKSRRAELA